MRKLILACLTSLLSFSLIFLFVSSNSIPTQEEYFSQERYVPNEVLVKFNEDVNKSFVQDAINSVQGKVITYLGEEISPSLWEPDISSCRSFRLSPALFHIKVPEAIGTEQAIYLLKLNPLVEYAEKNIILHLCEEPDDDYFYKQWGLHNTGQAGGTTDADIDAPEAWDISTGHTGIRVAVIDSGVEYDHEDLEDNIWINELEFGGEPGEDDDENGFIDDVYGWDFYQDDNDPMDKNGHGTHVAGIIGAKGNNGKGITGVNWNVSIMVLKAGDSSIEVADAISAIEYAVENGARLSNLSFGGYVYNSSLYNAIEDAGEDDNHLFIAAAGNDEEDVDETPHYPACFDLPNIISVAATSNKDELSNFSNYGDNSVDLGAPGGWRTDPSYPDDDIYSTWLNDSYEYKKGTSMATPHVTGVAALILSVSPSYTYSQVKDSILNNVDELDSLSGMVASEGRLNAFKAVFLNAPSNLNAWPTAYNQINLSWQDNSGNENGFRIYRGTTPSQLSEIETVGENTTYFQDKTCSIGTTYYYQVTAYAAQGESAPSNTANATIPTGTPAAPSDLRGIYGANEVMLRWDDNANNEALFSIERKTDWDPWEEIDTAGPNATMYWDSDLPYADILYYRVRAYNQYGYSSYSNTARVICPEAHGLSLDITHAKKIVDSGERVGYIYKVKK